MYDESMIMEIVKITLIAFVFTTLNQNPDQIFYFYRRALINMNLPFWITNPLGLCYKCFVGQVCFWYFIIAHWNSYNVIDHLAFTSAGIMLSMVLHKLYCWMS